METVIYPLQKALPVLYHEYHICTSGFSRPLHCQHFQVIFRTCPRLSRSQHRTLRELGWVTLQVLSPARWHSYAHASWSLCHILELVYPRLCERYGWNNPLAAATSHALPCILSYVGLALWTFKAAVQLSLLQFWPHPGERVDKVVRAVWGGCWSSDVDWLKLLVRWSRCMRENEL